MRQWIQEKKKNLMSKIETKILKEMLDEKIEKKKKQEEEEQA